MGALSLANDYCICNECDSNLRARPAYLRRSARRCRAANDLAVCFVLELVCVCVCSLHRRSRETSHVFTRGTIERNNRSVRTQVVRDE